MEGLPFFLERGAGAPGAREYCSGSARTFRFSPHQQVSSSFSPDDENYSFSQIFAPQVRNIAPSEILSRRAVSSSFLFRGGETSSTPDDVYSSVVVPSRRKYTPLEFSTLEEKNGSRRKRTSRIIATSFNRAEFEFRAGAASGQAGPSAAPHAPREYVPRASPDPATHPGSALVPPDVHVHSDGSVGNAAPPEDAQTTPNGQDPPGKNELNLLPWHRSVTNDACDPAVLWKVRQAFIGVRWHLLALRDATAEPSNGADFLSTPFLNWLAEAEARVLRWPYEFHTPSSGVPKCARDGYWNELQNDIMTLKTSLHDKFLEAVRPGEKANPNEVITLHSPDYVPKSYQELVWNVYNTRRESKILSVFWFRV